MRMKDEMYQNIVIVLSNGRLVAASVPVFFQVGDPPLTVRELRVSPPQKLPEGTCWESPPKGED